ncbi:MAG: Asp23/Gls24 family envelope stress response protein [Eubacteriales bacterium]|nr:Asp23/Gls24 family envelope stress response protein [Eubacteriales bacterium]MDD4390871.1 Asp23/Gls24 family envelope stress response protein [Eubacteriales bacterium]
MKIYALVGKSGTGKSYSAINLCRKKDIEAIIDDGLFIAENRILAGISAKRQATTIGAIKTALFTDPQHCTSVYYKIREVNPESILIIGTSLNMVEKIRQRLELPAFEEIINIEDITTNDEREVAKKQRQQMGKHVIPVPTFQIKKEFSGYFVDPLRIFKGFGGRAAAVEKSVVRPTYSYLGGFSISDKVIIDLVSYIVRKGDSVAEVIKSGVENFGGGIKINLSVIMIYKPSVVSEASRLQSEIADAVEEMTSFNVEAINIEIRGLRKAAWRSEG